MAQAINHNNLWRAGDITDMEAHASLRGHWGKPTALLDWCEENYIVHWAVAEFWNTISNGAMVFLSMFGMMWALNRAMPGRIVLSHFGLFAVGLGSAAFHGTLLYEAQLMDELPMVWAVSFLIFSTMPMSMTKTARNKVITVLTVYAVGVSLIYMYNRSVMFHEVMYTCGVIVVAYESMLALRRHPTHSKQMKSLLYVSFAGYLGATAIWVVDNTCCEQLRLLRAYFGPYIAPLFQFHAIWHLGTGYGTYCFTCFNAYAKALEMDPKSVPTIRYVAGVLPWIDTKPGKA